MPRAPLPLLFALVTLTAPARADLVADADRLAAIWTARGASVERRDPIFLERGRARGFDVKRQGSPALPAGGGCVTVAVLAARTTELLLDDGDPVARKEPDAVPLPFLALPHPPEEDRRIHSAGGAALLTRCGALALSLSRFSVEVTSPRAAVEILVVRGAAPPSEIADALPERALGPIAPRGDPGGPIEPGPIAARVDRAERRARSEGAARVVKSVVRAAPSGSGHLALKLGDGCHRLDLMAEVPSVVPRRATDLDAEAHVQESGRLLARDRADVPDARLDFCVGEQTMVEVAFAGASGAMPVTVSDAVWPTPKTIPVRWGARARAGFAGALMKRHVPAPIEDPIVESVGVQGVTQVPIAIEPGRCYLAAVAVIRGEARVLRLAATLGDRAPHDEVVERPEGAAIAFCAETERSALVDVDVRGNAPWWTLAVWGMGRAGF